MAGLIISVGLLVSVSVCISGIVGEPHCSPFHYHEQLLERMIDVKYKMDALTGKMDEWEKTVAEKLGKMDDNFKQLESRLTERVENHQSHLNNTITERFEKMEASLKQNENRLTERVENQQSYLNDTIAERFEKMEESLKQNENRLTERVENQQSYLNDTIAERFEKMEESLKQNENRLTERVENQQSYLNDTIAERFEKMEESLKQNENRLTERVEYQQSYLNYTIAERFEKMEESLKQNENRLTERVENQQSYLIDTITELEKMEENLRQNVEDKVKTPLVLFKARNVANKSPSVGDTIVFQTVVQNEGSGYDINTGIFTAPVSGTYLFTAQFCLYSNKELSVQIVANDEIVTAAHFGDKDWSYICTSTDGMAILEQGEESKMQISYVSSGTVIYPDSNKRFWTYFSGVLINK